jgi:hypothetical protein
MNRDDIIRMAREAGWTGPEENVTYVAMLERFANLVAAAEREACAKVCEELGYYVKHGGWTCADEIRERGAP